MTHKFKKTYNNSNQTRKYGYYHCTDCNRHWESGNSWEGFTQQCSHCFRPVYAYKLESLIRKDELEELFDVIDRSKPHRQDLCMKCQKLGFYCRESKY